MSSKENTSRPEAGASNAGSSNEASSEYWIELKESKDFSRLLYTNPVCLLTTVNEISSPSQNVMVISWLAATNNQGKFMMSINKNRHTAQILTLKESNVEFVLCVPVSGMETLVKNVGSVSGKWGKSKFWNDDPVTQDESNKSDTSKASNNKKRRRFQNGIEGLHAVQLGSSIDEPKSESELFAVKGTVAHLKCCTYRIVDGKDGSAIDEDHHLILCEVKAAFVHRQYWNEEKKRFQPKSKDVPPYLTFFGSQAFGYVVSEYDS